MSDTSREAIYASDMGPEGYFNVSQSRTTARHLVPLVLEAIGELPRSVVDVGCASGVFLDEFQRRGVPEILGIDAEWVPRESLQIPAECFISMDFRAPVQLAHRFDLALSLEVAEHIEAEFAEGFVDYLVSLAPVIVFSAALPLQGGTYHVNCRWPEYWAAKFRSRAYVAIDCLRDQLLPLPEVGLPYAQNVLIYVDRMHLARSPALRARFDPHLSRVPIKIRTQNHPLAGIVNRLPPLPREWLFYVSRRLLRHSPI